MERTTTRRLGATIRMAVLILFAGGLGNASYGEWSDGKPIMSGDEELIRYDLDLLGGVKLHAMVTAEPGADDSFAVRAVHLVPNADLGVRHWLYYAQEACRWNARTGAWANLAIGGRMPLSIPVTSWAADEASEPLVPNGLDMQLLGVPSAAALLALFDGDRTTRASIFPVPQRLNEETGFCAPVAAEGDTEVVGNVVLTAAVDNGSRAVDLTRAAESLHETVALDVFAGRLAAAAMIDVQGVGIGEVTFEQTPSGVLIGVAVQGLAPGAHGIHLHSVGACEPDFKASKGHINPDGAAHGLRHPDGPDNGDLPLLHVDVDGTAHAEFYTTRVSLSAGSVGNAPGLFDSDGSAVDIHALPDDHLTQPIGGAGGRVGCGVIEPI